MDLTPIGADGAAIELAMRVSVIDGQLHLIGRLPLDQPVSPAPPSRPRDSVTFARDLLWSRRLRARCLDRAEFGEPAWDMLLDLYVAHRERRRVSVSSLCLAAGVPPTTALRWINQLVEVRYFVREADRSDGRRCYVALSAEAVAAMETCLGAIGERLAK